MFSHGLSERVVTLRLLANFHRWSLWSEKCTFGLLNLSKHSWNMTEPVKCSDPHKTKPGGALSSVFYRGYSVFLQPDFFYLLQNGNAVFWTVLWGSAWQLWMSKVHGYSRNAFPVQDLRDRGISGLYSDHRHKGPVSKLLHNIHKYFPEILPIWETRISPTLHEYIYYILYVYVQTDVILRFSRQGPRPGWR